MSRSADFSLDSGSPCDFCGARKTPPPPPQIVSEEYRPWCRNMTSSFELMCDLCREYEQLQDQINRLLEKRTQLKARITLYHRSEIMQKILPEVLSNIFQLFVHLPSDDSDDSKLSRPVLYSPFILGAICRRWRVVAWSTPRLWSSIAIDFDTGSLVDKLQLVREWLSRSGQLPLFISVTAGIGRDLPPLPVSHLSALVDIINGYACRWRALDIRLPHEMLPLFHSDPHGMSILHTLKIAAGTLFAVRLPKRFNAINPPPSPIVVEIHSVDFQSLGIRWDRVTHFRVMFFSIDECFEIFRQAPFLTDCRFTAVDPNQNHFPLPQRILAHPNLTSLHVGPSPGDVFFQHLCLPSLQFLSLEYYCVRLPTQELVAFLRRSSPPLRELHLLSFENEESDSVIQILNETPSLKIFHLHPYMDDDHNPSALFQHLAEPSSAINDDGAKFLPQLETVVYFGKLNFFLDLVVHIFGPSWRPLRNFRFHCYGLLEEVLRGNYADEATCLQLQNLTRQGITIEIKDAFRNLDFLDSYWWLPLDDD